VQEIEMNHSLAFQGIFIFDAFGEMAKGVTGQT
jgi:hypothetical protein